MLRRRLSCAALISKVERHILDRFCVALWWTGSNRRSEKIGTGLEATGTKVNINIIECRKWFRPGADLVFYWKVRTHYATTQATLEAASLMCKISHPRSQTRQLLHFFPLFHPYDFRVIFGRYVGAPCLIFWRRYQLKWYCAKSFLLSRITWPPLYALL